MSPTSTGSSTGSGSSTGTITATSTNAAPPLLQSPLVDPKTGLVTKAWGLYLVALASQSFTISGAPSSPTQSGTTTFITTSAKPDNITDNGPKFQSDLAALAAVGGGTLIIPGGALPYLVATSVSFSGVLPITVQGQGRNSMIKRAGTIPNGVGMFDIIANTANLTFSDLLFDGAITTSTGLLYSALNGDPLNALLTQNTMMWVHDGCSKLTWSNVVIQHCSGYAILCNAVNTDITDLMFDQVRLENNRQYLFGITSTMLNFGSWCNGVLLHGNGSTSTAMVRRARFTSCSAYRSIGNCFWQHLYGFSSLHEDISFIDCHGVDCGLDFILLGGVINASVIGGSSHRTGYITTDDTSPSIPRWINGAWAVAVDHSGLVMNATIVGFTALSCNGAAFDCDGLTGSVIVGNSMRIPRTTDPEYVEDSIGVAGWAGAPVAGAVNYAYGIQTGNTSQNTGGASNTISGNTIINFCAGAIRIYAGPGCIAESNNIEAPPISSAPPIAIGNTGTAANVRSTGVVIRGGRILYDPAAAIPAIFEDATYGAFQSGDTNYVLGVNLQSPVNHMAILFQKNSATSSVATITQSVGPAYVGTLTFTDGYATNAT